MMKLRSLLAASLSACLLFSAAEADALCVAERCFPTPGTVSPELARRLESQPLETFQLRPRTTEEWVSIREGGAKHAAERMPALYKKLGLTVSVTRLGGVEAREIVPAEIPEANRGRVLLHLHGGGFVLNPGAAGTTEAAYMAGIAGFRVFSVDYRMPPEDPFPAALEDAVAAYRELLKTYAPGQIGVFGTSAGGGLTFSLLLKLKELGLPLPGAAVAGTPWADLTKTGDSFFTNAFVDNVLVQYDAMLKDAAELYASGRDLKDPMLSPIYGDLTGLPPVFLGTGTRDLFLSITVLMHKKLREAGVDTDLIVLEGASHADYMMIPPDADEARFFFGESGKFLEKHLKP